ncbi:hypothetical protein [Flavobacterium johnsoniae]|uniref:Bacteroides conjugative transposon TraI-like protein n=1 Tax=Flavobacterium johnsoniae TaxID=986 RepID=A0A1J7BNP9_FLAJO|nr:hypothetical protein [Flavobacterium johnsoniae]OIV40335.1 hypothetical protein BKM63_20575 [Flavobacterium johnsoniae]
MKKLVLLLSGALLLSQGIQAQAKQRKELLLQIGALQVYMDYARKGYRAVSEGLSFIGDAKRGEVNLHRDYFASLLKINPKVRNYYKTAEIISLQLEILKTCRKTHADLKSSDLFHGDELDHIRRSFERLLDHCSRTLDELLIVTSDAALEIRDDQRTARIDALHKAMMEDYDFCISFSREAALLSVLKAADKKESKHAGVIYGL